MPQRPSSLPDSHPVPAPRESRVAALCRWIGKRLKRWGPLALMAGFFPAYYVGFAGLCVIANAAKDLPPVDSFWEQTRPVSVQIVDRNGRDLLVRGAHEARPVSVDSISPFVIDAVMAVEDRRFYAHAGVDPIGLTRAVRSNLKAGRVVQGGSTLSQQLAKNVFLTSDRTLKRKVQESLLAIWLERTFSKDEIFEKYLNRIYFGGNAWGLEAGSQQYFRKSAAELDLGESAVIAALLKGPSRYNPVANPDRAGQRTATVLAAMERSRFISREERRQALLTPIDVFPPRSTDGASYFTDWIWEETKQRMGTPAFDIIIRTTLDGDAQAAAQAAIDAHIDPSRNATQAALITLDGSGGVRAMIGGVSYGESQFNRAVQASRQAGSAFKPFVYLSAFDAGLTPWDRRVDAPIKIGDWEPGNFSNKFKGEMSLETAFALSINTVAVSLSEEVGRDRVVETAASLGLPGLQPLRSLPLGAQNVAPLDLTAAYLPFANWGDAATPYGIMSISTADGVPLYDRPPSDRRRVVASRSLGHMNRIMTQTVKSGTGRAARLDGLDVGGKTGTTNDYRDAWFIGYVPDLVTGVWVGNDDNTAMKRVTGGTIPAQIWHDMMAFAAKDRSAVRLPVSDPPLRANAQTSLDLLLSDIETALPQ